MSSMFSYSCLECGKSTFEFGCRLIGDMSGSRTLCRNCNTQDIREKYNKPIIRKEQFKNFLKLQAIIESKKKAIKFFQ